jgi:replicative DNA helicase
MEPNNYLQDNGIIGTNIPPHSVESEKTILGSLIMNPDNFEKISIVSETDFYSNQNKTIFALLEKMYKSNITIDLVSLAEYIIKEDDTIDLSYLSEIDNSTPTSANIETHCKIIKEYSLKRQLIALGGRMIADGYDKGSDVLDSIAAIQSALNNEIQLLTQGNTKHISEITVPAFDMVQNLQSGKIKSIPTANYLINYYLKGGLTAINPVTVVAARPGEGKTAYLVDFANNASSKGYNVLIYSLEMNNIALAIRLCSNESNIDSYDIYKYKQNNELLSRIADGFAKLHNKNIWIDDRSGWHVDKLAIDIANKIKKHNINIVLFDFLQIIRGSGKTINTRENEITYICNRLQESAKSNCIPFLILAQLSRDAANKRPDLSNLRESGAIEQVADNVIFLYSKDVDRQTKDEIDIDLILAKNRDGRAGIETVKFYKKYYKFTSIEREREYQDPPEHFQETDKEPF